MFPQSITANILNHILDKTHIWKEYKYTAWYLNQLLSLPLISKQIFFQYFPISLLKYLRIVLYHLSLRGVCLEPEATAGPFNTAGSQNSILLFPSLVVICWQANIYAKSIRFIMRSSFVNYVWLLAIIYKTYNRFNDLVMILKKKFFKKIANTDIRFRYDKKIVLLRINVWDKFIALVKRNK